MFVWLYTIVMCISAWAISLVGTYAMREASGFLNLTSEPNERDNHNRPTPKGGGLFITLAILGMFTVTGVDGYVIGAIMLLLIISFTDDISQLSPLVRFCVQLLSCAMIVSTIEIKLLDNILPSYAAFVCLTFLLVWFVNLYNFMDGIDEITSSQTVMISAVVAALSFMLESLPDVLGYDALLVISAVTGFWYFNRHPATIFMGDSGSVPLGAITGWLLLTLTAKGFLAVALILPAYYLVDSGITLLSRLLRGKKIWQAHSEHAYQRYVRSGRTHTQATAWIGRCNGIGAALALFAATEQYELLIWVYVAAAYSAALLLYLFFITRSPLANITNSGSPASRAGADNHAQAMTSTDMVSSGHATA